MNNQQENGRIALQIIEEDLTHAGFWGSHVPDYDDLTFPGTPTQRPTAIPDPCLAFSSTNWNTAYKNNLIAVPIQASGTSLSANCDALTADAQANSDSLVVRYAENCVPGEANCDAYVPATGGSLYFQNTRCVTEASNSFVLDTSGYSFTQRDCTTTANVRKFISRIYYVRDYAITPDDDIPTLMRSDFNVATQAHSAAQALVPGIQAIRIEFGIDYLSDAGTNIITGTDSAGTVAEANKYTSAIKWYDTTTRNSPTNKGDGTPDATPIHCDSATSCTVDQLANVVTATVYVLARTEIPTTGHIDTKTYSLGSQTLGPFNDGYKRHVYSRSIRLHNISSRRETP
jgi:type IV pilus assembly protein PilW